MMNHKWYSLRVDETEKILGTNAASGLTRKAARSRTLKSGGNDFFYVESRDAFSCARSVLADPMLLLLVGVDIVDFCGVQVCRGYVRVTCPHIAGTASVNDVLKHVVGWVSCGSFGFDTQCVRFVERQVSNECVHRIMEHPSV